MTERDVEDYHIRYSTCAYFDVYAFSDEEHEKICEEIYKLISQHELVGNINVGEV